MIQYFSIAPFLNKLSVICLCPEGHDLFLFTIFVYFFYLIIISHQGFLNLLISVI